MEGLDRGRGRRKGRVGGDWVGEQSRSIEQAKRSHREKGEE